MGFKLLNGLALVTLIGTACTPKSEAPLQVQEGGLDPRIISDRPIKQDRILATIKLSEPALYEVAKHTEKGLEIPAEASKAIQAEQDAAIAALKKLSPEIQILARYRMVLNAVAFVAPAEIKAVIEQLRGVQLMERSQVIGRPILQASSPPSAGQAQGFTETTVDFIEASRVHQQLKTADGQPVRGQKMRVGVIDTGIDYTHAMLGGSGKEEDFKSNKPDQPSAGFPNAKVVGGIDLVGTAFDAGSELPNRQLPVPDANPIDEAGHGSHVAGTIAGLGDNTSTYSGVAPDALLYAIKVFGADGSTSDFVVVSGFEFAADPDGDGDPKDRLDVVNLSLGSGFGQPRILYSEAIRNLSLGGTVVVASAGNSGPTDYIVGAPGTADDAFSVAASVDNMPHNWKFPAIEFHSQDQSLLIRAIEGPISKPIAESGDVKGDLVYIGLGDQKLSDELKRQLRGKVALIDRGGVPFLQKLQLAEAAGAVGAVVANNQPGNPIAMGGEGAVKIPAVMIAKEVGDKIKEDLKTGIVQVNFNTGKTVEDPKRIDTITTFSSKGPRSVDSLLKPEITAPGENIISAAMGSGNKAVRLSGTSMSGPHMAGVMALLKQYQPQLSAAELKSLVMTTAKSLHDSEDKTYPLSLQGAGRVRTYAAAVAPVTMVPAALSLGNIEVGQGKTLRRQVQLRNRSKETMTVTISGKGSPFLQVSANGEATLEPNQSLTIPVLIRVQAFEQDSPFAELNGQVLVRSNSGAQTYEQSLPILAIVTKISDIEVGKLKVFAPDANESVGAHAELSLQNRGHQSGSALLFNLIGYDQRKNSSDPTTSFRSRSCDLESAGYRIVKKIADDKEQLMLQVAVKLYEPLTTWNYCEISVQLDTNNDQLADQELVGIARSNLSGLAGPEFSSLLLDAKKAREIRTTYEEKLGQGEETPLSYVPAVLDVQAMRPYNHSTVAVIEAPLSLLKVRPNGDLALKVAALYADSEGLDPDDFLGGQLNHWLRVSPEPQSSGYHDMPEIVDVAPGQSVTIPLTRGAGREKLVVYMPTNRSARSVLLDPQAREVEAEYETENLPH